MHRPTLTLRRFGPMSFGLGYFENGIWVDHSVPDGTTSPGSPDEHGTRSDAVALDAVHNWYGCCDDSYAAEPSVTAGETDLPPSTVGRSERPTASVVAVAASTMR